MRVPLTAQWTVALVLFALAGSMAPARAQVSVFRSGTDAVRVDVLVTDSRGAPISGLRSGDFVVRDNGVEQRIQLAELEELPLHVVLALDTSGSVEGPRLERLIDAADGLLDGLHASDRTTLVLFADTIAARTLAGRRATDARALLTGLNATGWTAAFDAAWTALMKSDEPGYRPLIVLLSDGFDNRSWLSLEEVLETAARVQAVVYCVRVRPLHLRLKSALAFERTRAGATLTAGTDNFLEKIAGATGGRVLLADTDNDLQPAFVRILEEFRHRYVLTYVPDRVAPGGWHALEVKLRSRDARVTARRGYQRDWPDAVP